MTLINKEGFQKLLTRTRSVNAEKLAKICNIKIDTLYECKEASITKALMKAFSGETIQEQLKVD